MKNSFRLVLMAVLAVFIFGAVNSVKAQNPQYVRVLYAKMAENQRTMKSLKSTVRMERYNSQLKEVDDKREGTALFLPAGKKSANIRIDWRNNANEVLEILSVVDGKYTLYQPPLKRAIEGKTDKVQRQESALDFIKMSSSEMKQKFDEEWLGTEIVANVHSAYKVKLTPLIPMNYNYAEIWVTEDGMPVQFKMYEKNGDTTTVLLYNIERNAKISKSQLTVKLPKDIKPTKG